MNPTQFTLPAPRAPFPALDANSFDWEEGDDIFGVIRQLISGSHPGIFATVDRDHRPHIRWMASLSFEEMPWVYTLTSSESRKIRQIESNPHVTWMFCNADLSLILNLEGEAKVCRDTATLKRAWKQIRHKEQAYFLHSGMENENVVVIGTKIKSVECCTPKNCMRLSVELDEVKRVRWA